MNTFYLPPRVELDELAPIKWLWNTQYKLVDEYRILLAVAPTSGMIQDRVRAECSHLLKLSASINVFFFTLKYYSDLSRLSHEMKTQIWTCFPTQILKIL